MNAWTASALTVAALVGLRVLLRRLQAWARRMDLSSAVCLERERRRGLVRAMDDRVLGLQPAVIEAERIVQEAWDAAL